MIKSIVFDLGEVLVSDAVIYYKNNLADFTEVLEFTGVSRADSEFAWKKHWPKMKIGEEDISDFWNEFYNFVTTDVSLEEIKKLYNSKIIMDNKLFEFLNKLKESYPLYALANESKFGTNLKIEKFNLNSIFKKIYSSAYLHLAKPDPKIFEFVISDASLNKEEFIYIDNQLNNVEAAKALGIKAIHYQNLEQLKKELESFNISI